MFYDNIIMTLRQQHCTQQNIKFNYLRKGRLMSELHVNILISFFFQIQILFVCMLEIALFYFDNLANKIEQNLSV